MTNQPSPGTPATRKGSLALLKTILYLLAGLILASGLLTGIALLAGAGGMVSNLILPLQLMGMEAAANLVKPLLNGVLVNLGIAALVVSLALSGLLYAVGRLIGTVKDMERRLIVLEAGSQSV